LFWWGIWIPSCNLVLSTFANNVQNAGWTVWLYPIFLLKITKNITVLLQSDTTCASLCLLPPKQAKRECGKLMSIPMALFTWFHLLPLLEHNKTLMFRSVITLRELKKWNFATPGWLDLALAIKQPLKLHANTLRVLL